MTALAVVLALAFVLIAAAHVYWGFGGRWGVAAAIPQQPDGTPLFSPGLGACLVVAAGLAGFAYLRLALVNLLSLTSVPISPRLFGYGLSAIFAARTMGDFRFFGLFRKVQGTTFGRLDRTFYTPLCAVLALGLAILAIGTR